MTDIYPIDDELELCVIEPSHAETFFALVDANREAIGQWMRWVDEVNSINDVCDMIESWQTMRRETGCMSLGIVWKGQWVGAVFHLRPDTKNNSVEIGYWLAESARGHGLATRAVRKMLDITFDELGFNRVQVRIAPHNTPSLALAERLGLTREGVSRQAWKVGETYWDAVEFGVLAEQWRASASDNRGSG
ncbi:MAG: GNAT family protein [Phycisphaeraceae bacterium]